MYVESGYNVVRVSMRIVLRIGPPSYTILVRSCVSLCCCCTVVCLGLLQRIENEPDLSNSIISCDETWVFMYDPETKRQSMQWKSTSSPRPKNARMSRSKFKAMMIVFFDIQDIVMAGWVPSGQTVNQQYYIEVLTK